MEKEADIRWHEYGWLMEDLAGDTADLYSPENIEILDPAEQATYNAMDLAAGVTMAVEERYILPINCIADIIKAKQALAEKEGELTSLEIAAALEILTDAEETVLKEMAAQAKERGMVREYRNHTLTARIKKAARYRGFGVGLAASKEKRPRRK